MSIKIVDDSLEAQDATRAEASDERGTTSDAAPSLDAAAPTADVRTEHPDSQPEAQPEAQPAAQPEKERSGRGWMWLSIVLAVLLLLTLGGNGYQLQRTQQLEGELAAVSGVSSQFADQFGAVHERVVAVRQRLAELESLSGEIESLSAPGGLPAVSAAPEDGTGNLLSGSREMLSDLEIWLAETFENINASAKDLFSSSE